LAEWHATQARQEGHSERGGGKGHSGRRA
jgi:hypothetical protein